MLKQEIVRKLVIQYCIGNRESPEFNTKYIFNVFKPNYLMRKFVYLILLVLPMNLIAQQDNAQSQG